MIADARPSIHAEEVNGVTRPPSDPVVDDSRSARASGVRLPQSGDPVIDMAREEAFSFSETLPNYVVKQFTTRYSRGRRREADTSWRALDTVTADVVYQDGKESYKNFLVNGRPPREAPEKTRVLVERRIRQHAAGHYVAHHECGLPRQAFDHDREPRGLPVRFFGGAAELALACRASGQSYLPEYTGSVWIDKENYRVLRIELSARNMPRSFPLDQVESSVDYDYVLIGDQKYLLPVHSEALSCARGTNDCSRNAIEFRNYKKFSADTSITFDGDK